ncbi:hypothetical protein MKZ38_009676 [Zalerion maritima]|uniref:Uncharacterized protein n=1 Tax=Zalerion maritima TaxID=339359 RepID=A0AAD5RU92_9PEZI|nr:hypothetical protein MKZ38_009676 [Zalerion maritima]
MPGPARTSEHSPQPLKGMGHPEHVELSEHFPISQSTSTVGMGVLAPELGDKSLFDAHYSRALEQTEPSHFPKKYDIPIAHCGGCNYFPNRSIKIEPSGRLFPSSATWKYPLHSEPFGAFLFSNVEGAGCWTTAAPDTKLEKL